MTVKECYSQMGGDYNNVLSRFYDEAMIKRNEVDSNELPALSAADSAKNSPVGAATRVPYHKRGLRNPPAPMKKLLV